MIFPFDLINDDTNDVDDENKNNTIIIHKYLVWLHMQIAMAIHMAVKKMMESIDELNDVEFRFIGQIH